MRVSVRSRTFANVWTSFGSIGFGPLVSTPAERNCSIKFLEANRPWTVWSSNNSPRVPMAIPDLSTARAASGTSPVITRSSGCINSMILLSAMSAPCETAMTLIKSDVGTRNAWLATNTTSIFNRREVRKRISLIAAGQASASTQIRNWFWCLSKETCFSKTQRQMTRGETEKWFRRS